MEPLKTDFVKSDAGKPNLAILFDFPNALEGVANILDFGAKKYSRTNWSKCKDTERYLSACLRHILAYHNGERTDLESGQSHLSHAIACLLFMEELRHKTVSETGAKEE